MTSSEITILNRFNNRKAAAFGEVYAMYYNELLHFASRIYDQEDIAAADVVHDIFMKIWQADKLVFTELKNIKIYVYTSIKNQFKNYITHKQTVSKYNKAVLTDDNTFGYMIESEVFSVVNQAIDMLPEECATVFKLYVEGWSVKEISERLGRPERTIYNKKAEAISILQTKIDKDILAILMVLI